MPTGNHQFQSKSKPLVEFLEKEKLRWNCLSKEYCLKDFQSPFPKNNTPFCRSTLLPNLIEFIKVRILGNIIPTKHFLQIITAITIDIV